MRCTNSAAGRRAAVVPTVAVCLPVLMAVVALALDTGMIYDRQRHTQAAADAAALAGAGDLFKTYSDADLANNGKDPNGFAVAHALAVAKANGYPNDGTTADVVVNIPPKSGPFTNKVGYIEVLITYHQPRGFSTIFGTGDLLVGARAVARGKWEPSAVGIIALDPTSPSSLKLGGGAVAEVPSAAVIVNSSSPTAMYSSGTGNSILSEQFNITGGYAGGTQGVNFIGPIDVGVPPTPDPYRFLPPPNKTTMTPQNFPQTAVQAIPQVGGGTLYVLDPGVYKGGIKVSGQDSLLMNPGIYYMDAGGFGFSGQGSLTADGVMLYNDPKSNSQNITITGLGTVTWNPPYSGPYQGITMYQRRDSTVPVNLSGNGSMHITGVDYAAGALVNVSGNGLNFIGNQVVAWELNFQGNGIFDVPWDAGHMPNIRDLRLVE
jgi:Putative Flp pilus-assembly TadE/G-like